MAGDKLFHPKNAPIRNPLSDKKENGRVVNPPRMAHIGGMSTTSKGSGFGNGLKIKKPGGTK